MRPRLMLLAAPLALALLLAAAGAAQAGTYLVRQCHHSAPQNHAHEATVDISPNPGPYAVGAGPGVCAGAGNEYAIQTRPIGAALHGQYGLVRFTAPTGIRLVGVELDARLRSEAGHRARLSMTNAAGAEQVRFGAGTTGPTGFAHYRWPGGPGAYQQFTAGIVCDNPGFNCPMTGDGDKSKADIRNVQLTVRDEVAPTVEMDGDLVSDGWKRGTEPLKVIGQDQEAGLYVLAAAVNGTLVAGSAPLPCQTIQGTSDASRFSPCLRRHEVPLSLDTTTAPFKDGENAVIACAGDFGQNPNGTCAERAVLVDNAAPRVAFRTQQLREDPELIRAAAADATSGLGNQSASIEFRALDTQDWVPLSTGVNDGELQARVDSEAVSPGRYEFRAHVSDVAGNSTTTTLREDGQPMVLEFPLKEATSLQASLGNGKDDQVVPFRKEGTVAGRLLDEGGEPISGATVEVLETFEVGSLIDQRRREVVTDNKGRYASKLPGGPSRDVEVLYTGSKRFSADAAHGLDFDVRGKANLRISKRRVRAGRAVVFRGRVKRYFAQIPAGGKLVEVQVKSGSSWTTLQQATGTNRKGRVRLRHRFRGFYTQPVTFTFRLKATRESGWPYKGATSSKRQHVTVVPKR